MITNLKQKLNKIKNKNTLVHKFKVKLQYLSLKLKKIILLITILTSSKVLLVLSLILLYFFLNISYLKLLLK